MSENERKWTIEELANSTGVSVRTVRFYITQGLLPGPEGRGKATVYNEGHLLRLRLVRRLSDQRIPLAEIREKISGLSLPAIRSLLQEEDQRDEELQRADKLMSPKGYISELLRRARAASQPVSGGLAAPVFLPVSHTELHESTGTISTCSHAGEAWHRWELAPGVELHVKLNERIQHTELLKQILRLAKKYREGAGK